MLVVLGDWKLDDKRPDRGDFDAAEAAGASGSLVTVNSRAVPVEETLPPSSRVRLRIVNVADTRLMVISFNGVTPLILAVDGQPCEAFEPVRQTIPLGPGARFDVMFDLPGEAGADANVTLLGDNEPDRVLLRFKTAGDKRTALAAGRLACAKSAAAQRDQAASRAQTRYCDRGGEPPTKDPASNPPLYLEAEWRCLPADFRQRRCSRSSAGRR